VSGGRVADRGLGVLPLIGATNGEFVSLRRTSSPLVPAPSTPATTDYSVRPSVAGRRLAPRVLSAP
jgi:hypothetical protein